MNDTEDSEGLPSLDKPGWYSQGNWLHLHELLKTMTGKPEPKVKPSPSNSGGEKKKKNEARERTEHRLGLTLRLAFSFGRGRVVRRLEEIHSGVRQRRNVALGRDVDKSGCC